MNKFTPGPWHTPGEVFFPMKHGHRAETYQAIGIGNGASHIALVSVLGSQADEAQANARLIAAAPELLAALEKCQIQLAEYVSWHQKRGGCSVEMEEAEEQAREALNKAKGE